MVEARRTPSDSDVPAGDATSRRNNTGGCSVRVWGGWGGGGGVGGGGGGGWWGGGGVGGGITKLLKLACEYVGCRRRATKRVIVRLREHPARQAGSYSIKKEDHLLVLAVGDIGRSASRASKTTSRRISNWDRPRSMKTLIGNEDCYRVARGGANREKRTHRV
jgi:hypothetical protein